MQIKIAAILPALRNIVLTSEKSGFRIGLLVLAIAVSGLYLPVLAGYVPFPADVVLFFPPWDGTAAKSLCCGGVPHSELGDLVTQMYPWRTLNAAVRPWQAPLWNFHIFMGTPYQAMPMSALFFPLHWLFSLLPIPAAWSVLFILRSIIIAVTTAVFVKRLAASSFAALVSGFIFACSGWVLAFQGRPQLDSAMWLPLMFLTVDALRSRPSISRVALGAFTFALPVLAGHPEVAFEVLVVAVLYAAYRLFPLNGASRWYAIAFAATGILSVALAAVQLVPTLEWMGLITRTLDLRWGSLSSAQSLGFLSRDLLHNPNVDGIRIPEGASYIGACAAALLPFAFFWKRRRDVLFFAGLAFVCAEVAYGWQPAFAISTHIPVLAGLPNWRLLVAADFALAVLAGLGISAVQSRCAAVKLKSVPGSGLLWFLAAAAVFTLVIHRLTHQTAIPLRFNLLLLLLSLVIFVLAAKARIRQRDFIGISATLVAADLFCAGFAVIPFVRPAFVFPPAPLFDFLRSKSIPMWRVAPVDAVYGAQFELPYGLSTATGYDFPNRRTARILSVFGTRGEARKISSQSALAAPKGLLDLTGTRYFVTTDWNPGTFRFSALPNRFQKVFSSTHVQVFENPDAVPLVSFIPASAVQVIASEDDQFKAVTGVPFDGRRTVIVPRAIDRYWGAPGNTSNTSIGDIAMLNDAVEVAVSAERDGLIYFNETVYPGWVASVDGAEATVLRANYAFMAVAVRQGQHTVRFEFKPASFRVGGTTSALAVLVIAGMLAVPAARRRRGTDHDQAHERPDLRAAK